MKKLFALLLLFCVQVSAQIKVVQSAALSGPTQSLGIEMKRGIEAYLQGVSEINFSSKDDKYELSLCVENMKSFLKEGADVFLGSVGTPTSLECMPIAQDAKKIFFGAFTGAGFLSDHEKNPYTFSVRASYDDETEKMVEELVKKGISKIAVFIQDDGYGEVGKKGVVKALALIILQNILFSQV